MKQLIERFKLISAAINLEEESIISSQIKKLQKFSLDTQAEDILQALKSHSYDEALFKIENYKKSMADISAYKDPKIQQLQVQLRTLERDLNALHETKHENLNKIYEYISLYHHHLSSVLNKILNQRVKNAQKAFENGEIEKNLYDKIENQYKIFQESTIEHIEKTPLNLSQKDKRELQKLYKKANRTINPDILTQEHKKRTQKMFDALNIAYKKSDLNTVKKIQQAIENNPKKIYGFEKIDDKEALRNQSKNLQSKIHTLKDEIQTIQKSEIYHFLNSIENLPSYFQNLKDKLLAEENKITKQFD